MTQIDQLLAKALSTTSEDEAIACLRMARKKGGTYATTSKPKTAPNTSSTNTYEGYTAKEWCDAAVRIRQKYDNIEMYYTKLRYSYSELLTEKITAVRELEAQKKTTSKVIVVSVVAFATLGFLLL